MAADERREPQEDGERPKIVEAFETWRLYAAELEASLEGHYHRDVIGEWITGRITSRKFLVLIQGLDPESWFWTRVKADAEEAKADAKQETADRARNPQMAALYRNVPESKRKVVI